MSLQLLTKYLANAKWETDFACKTSANSPEAIGVEAEVPVKSVTHPWFMSVAHWKEMISF